MRALSLGLGAALDARMGDPPTRLHPVGLLGHGIEVLRAYAPDEAGARRRYGLVVALGLPPAAAVAGSLVHRAARRRSALAGLAAEVVLLSLMSSSRALLLRASEVEAALSAGDLDAARWLLGTHLVSRDTSALDAAGVAAATIESVAENLSDGVLASWLAYAHGGLPLAGAYRARNTHDPMWGYRNPEFAALGEAAAGLDDLANLLPARLTALAIAGAAVEERAARRALTTWRRDARATESPNAGHPMSAMAGALGVRLEKQSAYILGGGFTTPSAADIGRAVRVARRATLLGAAVCLGVALLAEAAK